MHEKKAILLYCEQLDGRVIVLLNLSQLSMDGPVLRDIQILIGWLKIYPYTSPADNLNELYMYLCTYRHLNI
jgi:hypothetical protein